MNTKTVFAGLALAGALAAVAAPAHAGGNVQWSVSIGAPGVGVVVGDPYWGHRAPVLVAPRPVYYYGAAPGYRHADADRDGIPNRYDRVYNPRWDRDGDGIPNRYDRNGRGHGHGYGHGNGHGGHGYQDRDRDGVPDWRDRRDGSRHDRDGDGVPNRWDRNDRNPRRG